MADNRKTNISRNKLSKDEAESVEEHSRLRAPVVHQIIREEGDTELRRPFVSLLWSGVAAGVGLSMSVVAEGLLRENLPDTVWRPVIVSAGYTVGFVIVVIGRLQLFTENTITAVLPLLAIPSWRNFLLMLRLWGIVFTANIAGTFFFALAVIYFSIFPPDQVEAFLQISREFMQKSASEMLLQGIPAGFLIAAMVWMIPSAKGAEVLIIFMMTYLISLGGMAHVIAGSAEAFLLFVAGEIGVWKTVGEFLVPTFVGNVIGGTFLFALLAHGQVTEEL